MDTDGINGVVCSDKNVSNVPGYTSSELEEQLKTKAYHIGKCDVCGYNCINGSICNMCGHDTLQVANIENEKLKYQSIIKSNPNYIWELDNN